MKKNKIKTFCAECDVNLEITLFVEKQSINHFCSRSCSAKFNNKKRAKNNYSTKDKTKTTNCFNCRNITNISIHANDKNKYFCKNCEYKKPKKNYSKKEIIINCKRCCEKIKNPTQHKKYCDDCVVVVRIENGIKSSEKQKEIRRSKNEIYFYELCKNNFNNVSANENFFNSKYGKWDADVILHELKIAVLWNGIWHYKQISKKASLAKIKARDAIKKDVIIKNGYYCYIVKDMGKYNKKFVEDKFEEFLRFVLIVCKNSGA